MSANDNRDGPASDHEGHSTVTIKLSADRAQELKRLAEKQQMSIVDLAKAFLETEIEAQHGLTYGPWLRRYMYRD
jgi:hypothetical protein